MNTSLTGIPETLLIPLWARAAETKRKDPIIRDELAVEIMDKINYDFSKFEGAWRTQAGVAIRTEILDREVKKFIQTHPEAVIVNIGCGLDTRFERIDNNKVLWYDLDLPEPLSLRKEFFKEKDRYKMIGKSVFDYTWFTDIKNYGRPTLFIAEGILMYFKKEQLQELMGKISAEYPKVEMLLEVLSPVLAKNSKKHETVKKTSASFKWGLGNGTDIEKLHSSIQYLNEWNYFDCHKKRWRYMSILAKIPAFRIHLNNKIVHISFRKGRRNK